MSSYNRRLDVEVVGNVSGFTAAMNRVNAGLTRMGSGLRGGRNEASLFNRQIQAIGTTARYYLAGQLVFGIQSAVRNLGEFKTQLGEVDALASQLDRQGHLQGLGGQLADVGSEAILMSNKFGIAVGDVESYMQRFFSSFNPKGTAKQRVQEMTTYTNALLNLTASLGTEAGDPQKLAGGLTGLINAIPGGRQHPGATAKTISDYFAVLLRQTPSLTGSDIATAAGRFASAGSLARMSVPQILSTFGVAAQTGGSPAVIIRGITQLLGQSLLHPTRPQSLRTYQAAGLPTDPNALAAMGGQKVIERLIHFTQQGNQGPGRRNLNLDAIYNAFSRQESVRQFVNLLAQGGVPALRQFNKQLQEGVKQNMSQQMAQKRLNQSVLTRMGVARQNLGMSLVSGADWPIEHLIADPLIGVSNFAARHRTGTQAIVGGALTIGAANSLRKLGIFSKLGRFGKLGKFVGAASGLEQAAISGAISKEELPAAIAGGKTDGSRANPYWVIISPLSWSVGSPGGFSMPSNTKQSEEQKAIGIAGKLWKRVQGSAKIGLGAAARSIGLVGTATIGAAVAIPGTFEALSHLLYGRSRAVPPGHPLLAKYAKVESAMHPGDSMFVGNLNPKTAITPQVNNILDKFASGKLSADRAEMLLRRLNNNNTALRVEGYAKLDVDVTQTGADGQKHVTKHRGVPVKLWTAKQFPTAKGKAGSRKGSGK